MKLRPQILGNSQPSHLYRIQMNYSDFKFKIHQFYSSRYFDILI